MIHVLGVMNNIQLRTCRTVDNGVLINISLYSIVFQLTLSTLALGFNTTLLLSSLCLLSLLTAIPCTFNGGSATLFLTGSIIDQYHIYSRILSDCYHLV